MSKSISTKSLEKSVKSPIDDRTEQVLFGIIDSYIHNSEPVGSRTLSKALPIELSPATIRNIMADLSEMGFLTQAHSSGGRIPTDKAYRFYVNSLAVADQLPKRIQREILKVSEQGTPQVEQLLTDTTRILAGLTEFVCLVTTPKPEVSRLQRIEFIKINSTHVLVILITKTGIVRNKVIESSEDLSQNFLNSVSQFLNEQFHDKSLLEIRNQILESILEDKERYDHLLAQVVRLGKKAFDLDTPPEILVDGQMNLMMSSQFREKAVIWNLFNAVEQKTQLMEVLDNTLDAEGVQIFIGMENSCDALKDCSVITAGYGSEHNLLGAVGVIGPTCMDYQTIIPVVDYTAKILSQTLQSHTYDD